MNVGVKYRRNGGTKRRNCTERMKEFCVEMENGERRCVEGMGMEITVERDLGRKGEGMKRRLRNTRSVM